MAVRIKGRLLTHGRHNNPWLLMQPPEQFLIVSLRVDAVIVKAPQLVRNKLSIFRGEDSGRNFALRPPFS